MAEKKGIHILSLILLVILALLVAFSYHPAFYSDEITDQKSGLGKYLYIIFIALAFLGFQNRGFLKSKFNKTLIYLYVWLLLFALIVFALGIKGMISDARAILIPILALFVGWSLCYNPTKYLVFILSFCIASTYVCYAQMFTNGYGFAIGQYFFGAKNQVGVMAASSYIALVYLAMYSANRKMIKIILYGGALLALVGVLTIRARTALVSAMIISLFILYKRYNNHNIFVSFFIVVIICIGVFLVLPSGAKQYIYDSMFLGFEGGDITSGRMDRNEQAIDFLKYNLFTGQLVNQGDVHQIHNYPLNKLYSYGAIFVLPIFCIYIKVLVKVLKQAFQVSYSDPNNIGYIIMLLPYIVSMGEPAMPFGPGTASVFNFILLGVSLRNSYERERQTVV